MAINAGFPLVGPDLAIDAVFLLVARFGLEAKDLAFLSGILARDDDFVGSDLIGDVFLVVWTSDGNFVGSDPIGNIFWLVWTLDDDIIGSDQIGDLFGW